MLFIMKIFKTYNPDIVKDVRIVFKIPAISELVCLRTIKLYNKVRAGQYCLYANLCAIFGLCNLYKVK